MSLAEWPFRHLLIETMRGEEGEGGREEGREGGREGGREKERGKGWS